MSASDQQPENPYQQPGFNQPNPYTQPTQGWNNAGLQPGGPAGPVPPGKGSINGGAKLTLAIVAAVALVASVAVGGVLLLGGSDDNDSPQAGETAEPDPSPEETGGAEDPEPGDGPEVGDEPGDDPRGGLHNDPDPVVDGWQAMPNYKFNVTFDVPEDDDWELKPGWVQGWEEEVDGEVVYTLVTEPAMYMQDYCAEPSERAVTGTRGAMGWESSTEHAAEATAREFAYAAYDNDQEGTLTETPAEPFENEHGFTGHLAVATIEDLPYEEGDECGAPSGQVVTVSYLSPTAENTYTWILVADTGVPEALDQETIDTMLSSLRWLEVEQR